METRFYGHACLKVRSGGGAVLMDPWFSRRGAFFGAWFQFPENTPLLAEALTGVDHICLSHNHADHLDPSVLVPAFSSHPSLVLHVPRYHTRWFAKRLARLLPDHVHRIEEHGGGEEFPAGSDIRVFFVPEESPGAVDSAIVCMAGGRALVNLNDSRLSTDQLLAILATTTKVDLLALQASGASEYPINYTYPERELAERSLAKRRAKIEHCLEIVDILGPDRVLFFAGPPVFLDPELQHLNVRSSTSVFPDQLDVLEEVALARPDIAARSLFLLPGEPLDDRGLWRAADPASPRMAPYTDKPAYVVAYRERREDVIGFDWGALPDEGRLLEHFRKMVSLSDYISSCIGGEITFVVRGASEEKSYTVDFVRKSVRHGSSEDALYVLTVRASAVSAILDGSATWDDAFLSFRMTFDERTDRFVAHLKTLLRYMDAEVFRKLELYEKQLAGAEEVAMIEVAFGGETFRIQRKCPHAGTDLGRHGRINPDGTITCLAHRFCFDLRTGDCLNATGYRLKTERPTSP